MGGVLEPVALTEQQFAEAVAAGVIDPETGEIFSQEGVEVIKQGADAEGVREFMATERGLPAPQAKELESAK